MQPGNLVQKDQAMSSFGVSQELRAKNETMLLRLVNLPITVGLVPKLTSGIDAPDVQTLLTANVVTDSKFFQTHAAMPAKQRSLFT